MNREEIFAAIKQHAQKLGRAPSLREFRMEAQITPRQMRKHCGSWGKALRQCGLEPVGGGNMVPIEDLFEDWAEVVRRLKKIPAQQEYETHSRYSVRPLLTRFGVWKRVPEEMWKYVEQQRLNDQYGDVSDICAKYQEKLLKAEQTSVPQDQGPWKAKIWKDRPIYGAPLLPSVLTYEPMAEDGVIFLFGALANDLGFAVTRVQSEFPDCEAFCRVDEGKWQEIKIEFELASKNFLLHMHDPNACDLIVCWVHDWPQCPLPVLELKREVRRLLMAGERK